MRITTTDKLLSGFVITLVLSAIILGCMQSCTSTKNIAKSNVIVDSTAIKELQDSVRVIKYERALLQQMIRELEYFTYDFDSTKCPQIVFPEGSAMLNKDSIQRLITELNATLDGMNNRVKTYADGSTEISGRLKSVTRLKEKESKSLIDLQHKYDSVRQVKQSEKIVTKTITNTVTKQKKTKVLNFWWLLLIGAAGGSVITYKLVKRQLLFNK